MTAVSTMKSARGTSKYGQGVRVHCTSFIDAGKVTMITSGGIAVRRIGGRLRHGGFMASI